MSFSINDIIWAFGPILGLFIGFFTLFALSGYTIFNQKILAIWLIVVVFFQFLFGEFYTGGCYLASLILLWLLTIKEMKEKGEEKEIINDSNKSK